MAFLRSSKLIVLALLVAALIFCPPAQVEGRGLPAQEKEEEKTAALPGIEVEGISFPATASPPGSSNILVLGGAGTRGLDQGGQFVVFTVIGVYLADDAIHSLAGKWGGKTADELYGSDDFYRDIYAGSFEKFTRVTMIQPLTGPEYSSKVAENCVDELKAAGTYTQEEAAAIEKFKEAFNAVSFAHGASVLFTHSPGSLTITFSKDSSIPNAAGVVIKNELLSEAVLESIIGKNGVSPAAKRSLADRLSQLLKYPST